MLGQMLTEFVLLEKTQELQNCYRGKGEGEIENAITYNIKTLKRQIL